MTRIPGVRRVVLAPYPYLIDYFVGDDEIVIQRFATRLENQPSGPAISSRLRPIEYRL